MLNKKLKFFKVLGGTGDTFLVRREEGSETISGNVTKSVQEFIPEQQMSESVPGTSGNQNITKRPKLSRGRPTKGQRELLKALRNQQEKGKQTSQELRRSKINK